MLKMLLFYTLYITAQKYTLFLLREYRDFGIWIEGYLGGCKGDLFYTWKGFKGGICR
jgi:hypothetical protein